MTLRKQMQFFYVLLLAFCVSCYGDVREEMVNPTSADISLPAIVHVNTYYQGSISRRYIRDLKKIFTSYNHLEDLIKPRHDIKLLHIHGAMVGENALGWTILKYTDSFMKRNIPICVTIHDYQWLFADNPNPTLDYLLSTTPRKENLENTALLFEMADVVIFPSTYIRSYYLHFSELNPYTLENKRYNIEMIPHIDNIIEHDNLSVPIIVDETINMASFGELLSKYGAEIYYNLIAKYKVYQNTETGRVYRVNFHLFGKIGSASDLDIINKILPENNFIYHPITVENGLRESIARENIQVLLYLSLCPQAFNYGLRNKVNLGLPVVYLNRGVFRDILDASKQERYFPVDKLSEVNHVLEKALNFTVNTSGKIAEKLLPRNKSETASYKWYVNNYPLVRKSRR